MTVKTVPTASLHPASLGAAIKIMNANFADLESRVAAIAGVTGAPTLLTNIGDMTMAEDVAMTPYNTAPRFDGDKDTMQYTSTGTALPGTLAVDVNTGIISGTPADIATTVDHEITATNAFGAIASNLFDIDVTA
jgi:hypothetical protein